MSDKAFLVDTSKCQGCRACQVACKQWNGLPGEKTTFFEGTEYTNPANLSAITWNHVKFFPLDRSNPSKPVWTIMHKKCYHCKEANCLAVCPEKAISKVDGWTIIDQSKCIGCGACENECVYAVPQVSQVRHTNDVGQNIVLKDKSHKCNACTLNKREIPACVNTCPSGALLFGNRLELLKQAKSRVAELKKEFPRASLYGEKEFGGLRVLTILRDRPAKFGLPIGSEAQPIQGAKAESIKDIYSLLAMFTFGLPSLKKVAYNVSKSLASSRKA